jgi:hypothetical protein
MKEEDITPEIKTAVGKGTITLIYITYINDINHRINTLYITDSADLNHF